MNPGVSANSPIFSSPALGQLLVGPLSHGCAVPASRLPPRVLSASGRRPAPTDAAAETGRWATSHRDVAAPKGGAKSRLPLWGRWTRVSEDGEGKLPAAPSHGLCGNVGRLPSQSRLPPCQLPQRGSQVSPPPLGEVSCLWHDGEGSARPTSRHSAVREKRFAVSLVSLWLTPI